MKRRLIALSLVMFALAVPATARVLSYAPYSNRTSLAGFHERNTRHFLLIESVVDTNYWHEHQLVLYDAKGEEEPRVVYPIGGTAYIEAAALYEPIGTLGTTKPMLLVTAWTEGRLHTFFSHDGGEGWQDVTALRSKYVMTTTENDFGGPHVQGMTNPIRNGGADQVPFIVNVALHGVYAVLITGEAVQLVAEPEATVIGQDKTGTRLLIRTPTAIDLLDLGAPQANNRRKLLTAKAEGHYSGWITEDGSAYIQITHPRGRFLFFHHDDQTQFISGPYGKTPPSLAVAEQYTSWDDPMHFFAVPTHDYEGAWMLQRELYEPTTLSRHTRDHGVEKMWSDTEAPEVEALIPGSSGNTLLVQVHRDRSVELQRPFIDPALTIWRVGDPWPSRYDELYLNEEWNKGFVHVDVDKMAEGEPFVFNSGATRDDGDIITSPAGGGGDVIQEWGVVRASLRQHLVLPGVARLHGAFGSRWLTDVTLFNPEQTAQDVEVRFVPLGADVQTAEIHQKTLTLKPNEIRFIPDALHALFSIADGGGALHFIPASNISAVGRTYSHKGEGGGTFGFGMQAIDIFNAAGPRFPMTFAGAFPGQNFRTNVLLTDTSGRGAQASLGAFGVSGSIGATARTIDAPPGGILQFNGLGTTLDLFSRDAGGLVIQPTRGTAIATVVAIDNRTNDPTYFPPDLPASDKVRAIPVIGHVDGANGSHFRSDLYLFNPTGATSTVTLEAKQWDGPTMKQASFTLLPREARVITDALPTLFDMTGLARLRYWSDTFADGVRVTSRTYTIEESGATYGSLIPPLNQFQIAADGDYLEILGVNGGSGFRTNVGLVELSSPVANSDEKTYVNLMIFDQNFNMLNRFQVQVPRGGGIQINDIFTARGIQPPEAALLVVQNIDGGGLIGAYVTLVDNITNDTTYLGAQLGAQLR